MDKFTPAIKLEHADARGEIYSIALPDDKELMLLHSLKGALRGGHSHTCSEVIVLLTGDVAYTKRSEDGNKVWYEEIHAGDASYVPAGEYHLGEFLNDSWLLEWKIGVKKGEWKNIDYTPYRERVKANAGQ